MIHASLKPLRTAQFIMLQLAIFACFSSVQSWCNTNIFCVTTSSKKYTIVSYFCIIIRNSCLISDSLVMSSLAYGCVTSTFQYGCRKSGNNNNCHCWRIFNNFFAYLLDFDEGSTILFEKYAFQSYITAQKIDNRRFFRGVLLIIRHKIKNHYRKKRFWYFGSVKRTKCNYYRR